MKGCFVTGTDTNVGKTHIAAMIVRAKRAAGERVAGLSPFAAETAPMANCLRRLRESRLMTRILCGFDRRLRLTRRR